MTDNAVSCSWFALCDRDAIGTVSHPILGGVPTCGECAEKLALVFDDTATVPLPPSNPVSSR